MSVEQGKRLLTMLDSDDARGLAAKLALALEGASDHCTIVLKDDEAELVLDLLEPTDSLRPLFQTALTVMKSG
jgi:hypothetical protein